MSGGGVFLFVFFKLSSRFFTAVLEGERASDYTLHSCGGTLHESKCSRLWVEHGLTHLNHLCSCVYSQVYTTVFARPSRKMWLVAGTG